MLFVIAMAFTACSGNGSNDDILSDIEQDKGININIEISPTSLTIVNGDSTALAVKVQSSDTNDFRVTWSSSNTTVATVNDEGKVNALAVGEAIITVASVVDKTKKASCTINVKKPADTKTFTIEGVSFTMKAVEPGTFKMGSDTGNEQPVHEVTISKHYYMGETEVTQALWEAVMVRPVRDWDYRYGKGDDYPAYCISYTDVQKFLSYLSNQTGVQFRLPTEAEWEFAARGGNKSKNYTFSGSNNFDEVAWCKDNSNSTTHPVKTKQANELGLYDMSGNLWEWCSDWYDDYSSSAVTDPTGPPTSGSIWGRVRRGGSWVNPSSSCSSTDRYYSWPNGIYNGVGMRLACSAVFE